MTVYLLPDEPVFPPVEEAEPDGLIAIGGDLSPERLLQAYARGIFPWFKEGNDIYWYSPDPRMVIFPEHFRISDSLKRIVRSGQFGVSFDTAFGEVIRGCAKAPRPGQDGTWISHDFIGAYTELHRLGFAHSVEVFLEGELAGGLYGISLGSAFFGESMYFRTKNASKVALHALVERCRQLGFLFIDCQVESPHMHHFGATTISRSEYLEKLDSALQAPSVRGDWTSIKF